MTVPMPCTSPAMTGAAALITWPMVPHHCLNYGQHRGNDRLHSLYDAGDGGHDRHTHLLQGGLH